MPARRSSCSATDRRGPVEAGAPGAYLKCFLLRQSAVKQSLENNQTLVENILGHWCGKHVVHGEAIFRSIENGVVPAASRKS